MVDKISRAIQILRRRGLHGLVDAMMNIPLSGISNSFYKKIVYIPLIILHEIDIIMDEGSFAYPSEGVWKIVKIKNPNKKRAIPELSSRISGTRHGSRRHIEMMKRIYTYEDFVSVNNDDIVVDVGAYVGGFSVFASRKAGRVISIEPNFKVDKSLGITVEGIDNIKCVPKAAWHCSDTLEINKSFMSNENSILKVDHKSTKETFRVEADTVPNIVREIGFSHIDYLKIEAEGVEPEILEGALDDTMEIRKIAVDASPERDGMPVVDKISRILMSNGYECRIKDSEKWWGENIVFGKKV